MKNKKYHTVEAQKL